MGSSSKKRQTMAKMTRERAVKERRARKQEKKDQRKQAATAGGADASEGTLAAERVNEDLPTD